MDTVNLIDSFREFKELKSIDRETMMGILEEVFRNMIIKKYGADDNFDIIINPEKGVDPEDEEAVANMMELAEDETIQWEEE